MSYAYVEDFSEGFAAVKKKGCWGFVDVYGKQIISLQYDSMHSFREGRAAVQKKKFSVIDWFYPGFWDVWNEYESFKGVFRPGFRVEE